MEKIKNILKGTYDYTLYSIFKEPSNSLNRGSIVYLRLFKYNLLNEQFKI